MCKVAAALILFLSAAFGESAPSCRISFPAPVQDAKNIFSPAQEIDLGDAIAESGLSATVVLAENDPMLQKIAARLVHNAPLPSLRIRTFLVDIPEANAFVIPGGRVYVSRALVSLARNEDELAGIMAHEFGHLMARQQARQMSRLLKATAGVTEVSSRDDIFNAFSRMLESVVPAVVAGRRIAHSNEEADQMEADRLGLLIQAAAGYDPSALINAFDRLAQTKGNTGTFLSELFHSTPPEAKRLREMLKSLPDGCAAAGPDPAEFLAWRKEVLGTIHPAFPEVLHGVLSRKELQPPISGDLRQLRFSLDGRYILAQDTSSVTVLSVHPFAVLFRAPAPRASFAEFTPDSRELVFVSSGAHVERWNIADKLRTDVSEIPLRDKCATEKLSPDGRTLACVDSAGSLALVDVPSTETIFQKKDFGRPQQLTLGYVTFSLGNAGAAAIDFSPDARFFLAVPEGEGSAIAWDLRQRTALSLGGGLKKLPGQHFVFMAPDKVVVAPPPGPEPAAVSASILSFPSGSLISKVQVPPGPLSRAADPAFLVAHTPGKYPIGAVEMHTGLLIVAKLDALDAFGENYVAERMTGELALYLKGKGVALATAHLPRAELSGLRSSAVSADFGWLSASAETRAAIWNLNTGVAFAQFRAVDGGFFDARQHLLLDVPKEGDHERHLIDVDLDQRNSASVADLKDQLVRQVGPRLLVTRSRNGGPATYNLYNRYFEDVIYDVRDAHTAKTIWSKEWRREAPHHYCDPAGRLCAFVLGAGTATASDLIKHDPALKSRLTPAEKTASFLVETIDFATGESKQRTIVDMVDPTLTIENAQPLGVNLVIEDNRNRVLVFDQSTAAPRARLFGRLLAVDPVHGRIAVGKEPGRLVVYDAATGKSTDEFRFPAPLMLTRFRDDGRALLALTSTQEAITLEVH